MAPSRTGWAGEVRCRSRRNVLAFRAARHYVKSSKRGFAMSTGPNRILDEFAKLMTDAAGAAQGVRREVETAFRAQAERMLNSMDVVQREEFEAVREMAVKAREDNVLLAARVEALEARLAELTGQAAPTAAAKAKTKK
jgi:BMFP domain-containing protein YqiC